MHIVDRFDFDYGIFIGFMSLLFLMIGCLYRLDKNPPRMRPQPRFMWMTAAFWLIYAIHSIALGLGVRASSPFELALLAPMLVLIGAMSVDAWDHVKEWCRLKSTARPE